MWPAWSPDLKKLKMNSERGTRKNLCAQTRKKVFVVSCRCNLQFGLPPPETASATAARNDRSEVDFTDPRPISVVETRDLVVFLIFADACVLIFFGFATSRFGVGITLRLLGAWGKLRGTSRGRLPRALPAVPGRA